MDNATALPPALFIPPFPPRSAARLGTIALLATARRNLLAVWPESAYRRPWLSLSMLGRQVFVCNGPDSVHEALVAKAALFERKSPQTRSALRPAIGDGLFISDGPLWRGRRKLVAPIIHGTRMPAYAPIMAEAAVELRDEWLCRGQGAEVDALAAMAHLTAEVICRAVFGRRLGAAYAAEIVEGFAQYQRHIGQLDLAAFAGLPDWLPRRQGGRARRAAVRIRGALVRIVAAARVEAAGDGAVVQMLFAGRDADGAPLDDEAIRDEAAVLFLAGHETTASTLAWCWYLLSQAPTVEARLHAELDAVLGGRAATLADLPALPYVRAVVQEVLRLYPPVPIYARQAAEATTIAGQPVTKGAYVMVVPWLLHRHEAYWDDPDAFLPDRFLPGSPPPAKAVYVPFGIGPRVCAGATFGMTEAVLCLATLAGRVRLRLAPGAAIMPECRLTIRPGHAVPMRIALRE